MAQTIVLMDLPPFPWNQLACARPRSKWGGEAISANSCAHSAIALPRHI
jgi:hypothetical protein